MFRQVASKTNTQTTNRFRNSAQKPAVQLTREVSMVLAESNNATKDEMLIVLGKVISYIEVRKALMTDIGSDGYTNSLKGYKNKLEERIKGFAKSKRRDFSKFY